MNFIVANKDKNEINYSDNNLFNANNNNNLIIANSNSNSYNFSFKKMDELINNKYNNKNDDKDYTNHNAENNIVENLKSSEIKVKEFVNRESELESDTDLDINADKLKESNIKNENNENIKNKEIITINNNNIDNMDIDYNRDDNIYKNIINMEINEIDNINFVPNKNEIKVANENYTYIDFLKNIEINNIENNNQDNNNIDGNNNDLKMIASDSSSYSSSSEIIINDKENLNLIDNEKFLINDDNEKTESFKGDENEFNELSNRGNEKNKKRIISIREYHYNVINSKSKSD